MAVKLMIKDYWERRRDFSTEVQNPAWEEVRNAILDLDGATRTTVVLQGGQEDEQYMIIAGQWDGRCMVNATADNVDFFSLVDRARTDKKVILSVGGQNGEYEENDVSLDLALKAAKSYVDTGELTASLDWESDY